jgi:hypothetical protein
MAAGYGDVTVNSARMTVEKRGDAPPGAIAWRFVTTGSQIDTVGNERVVRQFSPDRTYFWAAEWRNSEFRLIINDGVSGPNIYNLARATTASTTPTRTSSTSALRRRVAAPARSRCKG